MLLITGEIRFCGEFWETHAGVFKSLLRRADAALNAVLWLQMIPGLESVKKDSVWHVTGFPVCGLSAALFGHCELVFNPVRDQRTDIYG